MSSDPNKQAREVDRSEDRILSISSQVSRFGFVMMIIGGAMIGLGIPNDFPGSIMGSSIVATLAGLILWLVGTVVKDRRSVSLATPEERAAREAEEANEPSFLRQLVRLIIG